MALILRNEHRDDRFAIRQVNEAAFGQSDEAELVDQLRVGGFVLVSLVAEINDHLVGHVLFSRMWIETRDRRIYAVALAPLAVAPEQQRLGIGSRLTEHGLELLRDHGEQIVIVLGHPGYYPRFGFSTEQARLLTSPFPPEAFMALELQEGALSGVCGKVRYPDPFGIPE